MKIFIKTYGCQANINDSEILAAEYLEKGYSIAGSENEADVILINSCSVKNKTQSKILYYIKKFYNNKNTKIIVCGCLIKTIDLKKQFPKLEIRDTLNLKRLNKPLVRKDKDIAIIQISQGCLNECSYCATKLAKGKLKSYSISEIKRAVECAVKEGCKKIYLTSQDNGCYGLDIKSKQKINLPSLINELTQIGGNYKIRVGMANPQYIIKYLPQLLKAFESDKIQKFIHIPVQSGSDKVLREMKRGHTSNNFIKIAKEFRKSFSRKKFKDSTIATDIIVGYPTETEKDFQKTVDLIKTIKPEVLNISVFSSRPKTQANKLKQLSSELIKQRSKKLNEAYWNYRNKIK
ncbi:MAG TPA: tRNA (N(6)-L-threonylcarbamoyladenosine(37)-C(2))-methylthiotransferase [Candidatus Paceibacterota bacterium]|nr:tRNA (N(6)-L-threonylcarbamoyladenosine(37)-C(2))-methylthiotransferase [Candidatus Paceibacterota bacterium]